VQLRYGARRMLFTLGTGLALVTMTAAGSAQAMVAPPPGLAGPVLSGGAGADPTDPLLPGAGLADQLIVGTSRSGSQPVPVAHLTSPARTSALAPLHKLLQADLFVIAPATLPGSVAAALQRLPGVVAVQQLEAARLELDGKLTAVLGVDPSAFRAFAARPTADSAGLWQNVADGGVAVSYTMSELDNLPLGHPVRVTGRRVEQLPVAGLGTVGIGGVDAVVSDAVARSLGMPADNAIVVSAPHADLNSLMRQVQKLLPHGTAVAPLVAQSATSGIPVTGTGEAGTAAADGPGLTSAEVIAFLKAAESRLGDEYVWGGDGPDVFDCSGLVQWSLAQAGVIMPRVAAEQALTGPQVPVSELEPGDLLFYHTDPTAPDYISHVAIYLGNGEMIQAPETGEDVEIVPAWFGSEFAGAVAVYPRVAAAVAGETAG
jgi:peptidoglycan DL-endopeptidase CwlO